MSPGMSPQKTLKNPGHNYSLKCPPGMSSRNYLKIQDIIFWGPSKTLTFHDRIFFSILLLLLFLFLLLAIRSLYSTRLRGGAMRRPCFEFLFGKFLENKFLGNNFVLDIVFHSLSFTTFIVFHAGTTEVTKFFVIVWNCFLCFLLCLIAGVAV